jgi:hypothetical protein
MAAALSGSIAFTANVNFAQDRASANRHFASTKKYISSPHAKQAYHITIVTNIVGGLE